MERIEYKDLKKLGCVDKEDLEKDLRSRLTRSRVEPLKIYCIPRLLRLVESVDSEFVDRGEAARLVMASLISGVPLVLLGPPGTAKSALIKRMVVLSGADPEKECFEWLLSRFTTPEELFGPPDFESLKKGVYKTKVEGKLPSARIAFLDEIFRGSSMILNTLLSILNERKFHDGNESMDIPLLGVVGASNQPPVDPDLDAFFDRFPIRVWLESVLEGGQSGQHEKLLQKAARMSKRTELDKGTEPSGNRDKPPLACLNDIRCAQIVLVTENGEEASGGVAGNSATNYFEAFRKAAKQCKVPPSDRTFGLIWKFGRALEYLRPDLKESESGPIEALRYIGSSPEERRNLGHCVDEFLAGHTTFSDG